MLSHLDWIVMKILVQFFSYNVAHPVRNMMKQGLIDEPMFGISLGNYADNFDSLNSSKDKG